jgi:hypothetical protein
MTEVMGTLAPQPGKAYPAPKVDALKTISSMCAVDTKVSPVKNRLTA